MILYLDTSSLVKLYVTEAHSSLVRGWAEEAEIIKSNGIGNCKLQIGK